jgi:hypothetical protein
VDALSMDENPVEYLMSKYPVSGLQDVGLSHPHGLDLTFLGLTRSGDQLEARTNASHAGTIRPVGASSLDAHLQAEWRTEGASCLHINQPYAAAYPSVGW